ncbi:MAG: hypothetical protein JJT90_14410 [Ectothiorhodospiraceae bacterium]|nr:hypothetical protein [Ectothiorhodospiraceae bacterium]
MIRITGFIAFALALAVMIALVIRANLDSIPEPYASCVELHRQAPDHGLGRLANMDLRLDEQHSRIETQENGRDIIVARVTPVARSAGRPVTLRCTADDGRLSLPDNRK